MNAMSSRDDFMPDTANEEQSDAQALSRGLHTRAGITAAP